MVIKCPKCGHLIDSDQHQCRVCGHVINERTKQGSSGTKVTRIVFPLVILSILALTWNIWGAFLFPLAMPNVLLYSTKDSRQASIDVNSNEAYSSIFSNRNGRLIAYNTIKTIDIKSTNIKSLRIPSKTSLVSDASLCECAMEKIESFSIDKKNKHLTVSDDGFSLWHTIRPWHVASDGIRIAYDESERELIFLSRYKNGGAVDIPEGITSLRANLFKGCDWVNQVKFPASMKKITFQSFKGCLKLSEVIIPGGVTRIDSDAFAGCDSLSSVVIEDGDSPLEIGSNAFTAKNCIYYIKKSTPPILEGGNWMDSNAFPDNPTILVPYQHYNSYYSAWKQYSKMIIPVTEVNGKLFKVSYGKPSSAGGNDANTITSDGVSITAPQTVWSDETFSVVYSFPDNIEDVRYISSDAFEVVSTPQKKVKRQIRGDGSESLVIEFNYILKPIKAGIHVLPRLKALVDGEEVYSPEKYVEVMHEEYN